METDKEELESGEIIEVDGDLWTRIRDHCKISNEDERWLKYADRVISVIKREDIWKVVVVACKILKYPEFWTTYRNYFDSLF